MHTVDLSNGEGKVRPNCIETIVVSISNRPEGLRPGIWVGDSGQVGRWGLSIVAFLAVSRDFLYEATRRLVMSVSGSRRGEWPETSSSPFSLTVFTSPHPTNPAEAGV